MDVSMVIAAWGEGVGLCVPLPLVGSLVVRQKAHKKIAGWVLGHAPSAARACASPHAKDVKYDGNIEANLQFFLHTYATVLTHWLYNWLNIDN